MLISVCEHDSFQLTELLLKLPVSAPEKRSTESHVWECGHSNEKSVKKVTFKKQWRFFMRKE